MEIPNYEKRLTDKINELMQGNYNPFEETNFIEAINNSDEHMAELSKMLAIDPLKAGLELRKIIVKYWHDLAKTEADGDLEDEYHSCERCRGVGCDACNDSQRDN